MKNFTRIITALLILALTLPLAMSCTQTPPADETTAAPSDSTAAPETEAPEVTEAPLTEQTVTLNKNTKGIKILGVRNLASDTAINADWSASGIEFVATCEGDMTFAVETNDKGAYFRAYVDGEPVMNGDSPYFEITGKGEIVLKDITKGTHTVRVIKVTGYTLAFAAFTSVKLTGYIAEEAPKDKELYVEFVGDSITCAWGTIGTFDGKYTSQDATLGYSYLLAEALDADYSLTALSGQGICWGTPGVPLGYKYACYGKDANTEYDFARKADLVVVNIGTNDETKAIDTKQFKADFESFIKYVREKNGDCKILAVYNMKNGTYADHILDVFEGLGGEGAGFYTYKARRSANSTASYHPSVEEHAAYVPELVEICKAVLAGEKINEKEQGGEVVDNESTLPENTVVVDPEYLNYNDGTVVTFTWNGQEYKAVVGKTASGLLSEAQDLITENGTLILRPGTYTEQFQISKNMTILGPKAGIDPNVKGLVANLDWTRNPERGEGEAIITGNWGFGVWNATVFPDCNKIVADGLQFSGAFLLRQNSAEEGNIRIELKNILIKEITGTNNILFFYPYYPKNSAYNLYKRDLLLENIRIEGLTTKPLFRMCADKLEIAGMYMDSASTVGLFGYIGTSDTADTDTWLIRDSMFRNSKSTIFELKVKVDSDYRMANIANKKMDVTITGCVFSAEDSTEAHTPFIALKRSDTNVSVHITNNTFLSNGTSSVAVSDAESDAGNYASATEISGNFASGTETPYKFDSAYDAAQILAGN